MGDLPDRSPNQPTELDIEELEENTIYAVLSYRGDFASWNWGFYVPDPSQSPIGSSGTVFHVVSESMSSSSTTTTSSSSSPSSSMMVGNGWELEVIGKRDIISWPLLVAIVKLADIGFLGCGYEELVGKDTLLPLFESVHIPKMVNKNAAAAAAAASQQQQSSPPPPPPPLSASSLPLPSPPPQLPPLQPPPSQQQQQLLQPLQQQQQLQPQSTEFSSRTWFLDAIFVLHDCGMLQCDDVWLLERELRRCAFKAMGKYLDNRGMSSLFFFWGGGGGYSDSDKRWAFFSLPLGWTAYEAERCS